MIANSGATEKYDDYTMVVFFDDASDESATSSTFCSNEIKDTTSITYLRDPYCYETHKELILSTKELNRIASQKILGKRIVDIPRLDFRPKQIRKNNRQMFCQRG